MKFRGDVRPVFSFDEPKMGAGRVEEQFFENDPCENKIERGEISNQAGRNYPTLDRFQSGDNEKICQKRKGI